MKIVTKITFDDGTEISLEQKTSIAVHLQCMKCVQQFPLQPNFTPKELVAFVESYNEHTKSCRGYQGVRQ